MKRKTTPRPITPFPVQLSSGYEGMAQPTANGWLRVVSADGSQEAAIQATPVESLAKILLAEIARKAGKA